MILDLKVVTVCKNNQAMKQIHDGNWCFHFVLVRYFEKTLPLDYVHFLCY
ncbi:MAG: hypothetical protein LBC20_08305 [Planctomycetaceae bacterium]|nr:hypothetical protein [Planctomycetaceae bacterium]